MDISHFYNRYPGKTALLVGNAGNLHLTPPQWFKYPSFGVNSIYRYEGWEPVFYAAVDERARLEFGQNITRSYAHLPKFIPTRLDWQGDNFYKFYHRPGPLFQRNGHGMTDPDLMTVHGITFGNVMHVAMQLAIWMGFTTLLLIGVEHQPGQARRHFWGDDREINPPVQQWLDEYREIVQEAAGYKVRILNISQDTYVPDNVLPRGNWQDWRNT